MTSLSDQRQREIEVINKLEFVFTGSKIWKHARVGVIMVGANAGKVAEANSAPYMFNIGTALRTYDASAADVVGTVELDQEIETEFFANGSAIAATDVLKMCSFLDDQTVVHGTAAAVAATLGSQLAGRIWGVDATRGVRVERLRQGMPASALITALPAYTANDVAPAAIIDGAIYDIPTTAAAVTISLPTTPPDGIRATLIADGTKNGHTVTVRDVATAITAALTASKRLRIEITSLGGKWFASAAIGP